ncbi:TerB family tellurite resistance protein [Pseudomaricurvus alkylphenolicus]|jgi:uncharacterized tellurite resistance protein B-like protein|uniref:tellurite resistance TerB family protein n=1 Tax=Pseudomaricurvus alkylphenolicus TaxID=1306991 RepID=UPI00141DAE45|nr:TerB family tellurite resistance protein [Pseudomaricurvus alkylphenolicus]NIB43160.1 TerB family tellurite resistance protein [Pseudomaricurvus alkylphenolicus]
MLDRIKSFFSELLETEEVNLEESDPRHLAAAALMIEIATIDEHFDATEIQALVRELQAQFQLDSETLHGLIDLARRESASSTSLYQFTRCVNDEFSPEEKFTLLEGMWRIAYADGNLDKYEEYMIRRIADLIHVAHGDFIRAKHAARDG